MNRLRIVLAAFLVGVSVTFGGVVLARPAAAAPVHTAELTAFSAAGCPSWVPKLLFPIIGPIGAVACSIVPGTTAPTPGMPGEGTAGTFDPTQAPGTSDYSRYGYSNLNWPLYDEGSTVLHPIELGKRTSDDTIGNALFGAAVDVTAAANGLQRLVDPPKFLGALDRLTAKVTQEVNDALWTPYSIISLLVLAVMIGLRVISGDHAGATRSWAWMILVIGLVSFATLQSTAISSSVDQILPEVTNGIYSHIDGAGPNAASAAGALEENDVLYPLWLQGELGSSSSQVAVTEGHALFDANGYTWAQANSGGAGLVKSSVTKAKAAEWQKAAGIIHQVDPNAYGHMTDAAAGRTSAGALALLYSLSTNLLRIVASIMTLVALIVLRFAVAIVPAVALVGVNDRWSGTIRTLIASVLVSIVGAMAFTLASALSIIFDSFFLNPAYLPRYVGATLAALTFWFAWRKMRPKQALAGMLGVQGAKTGRTAQRYKRRVMRGLVEAAGAGAVAGAVVDRHLDREEERDDAPAYRPETRPAPYVPDVAVPVRRSEPVIPPLPRPAWRRPETDDNPLHPYPPTAPAPEDQPAVAEPVAEPEEAEVA